MSSRWDVEIYRQRAKKWQDEAKTVRSDAERTTCLTIAEGYTRLVRLIEQDEALSSPPLSHSNTDQTRGIALGIRLPMS